jgi:dTDP-4-dehydrorhamnose reductase
MKILLLGKNGQVGWELRRTLAPLGSIHSLGSADLNFTDPKALRESVISSGADLIVNAAAYTAVDKAESQPEIAHQVNAIAPGIIAEAARQLGAGLIHYSTDYVFDGQKKDPYTETDSPNPIGAYGRSKLEGEHAIQKVNGQCLILRLAWVYGLRGHNFLLTMQRLAREGKNLRVVNDQFGAPTWSRMIAEATAAIIPTWRANVSALSGIYHLTCAGSTNWHGFASRIIELMPETERRTQTVAPIPTSEYPTPAKRPPFSVLDCSKLKKQFGVQLPDWEEALRLAVDRA